MKGRYGGDRGRCRGDMGEIWCSSISAPRTSMPIWHGEIWGDRREMQGDMGEIAHVDAHVERQLVARVIGARRAQHNTLAPG